MNNATRRPLWPHLQKLLLDGLWYVVVILLALAVSATEGWKRRLGKNWQRLHRLEIDRDDFRCLAKLDGNLAPTARRSTQVEDSRAGSDQMKLVIDFQQLVGRPRSIAVLLGLLEIVILGLLLPPRLRH